MLRRRARHVRSTQRRCALALALAALIAPAAIAFAPRAATADDVSRLEFAEWQVAVNPPRSWRISRQSSYPNILVALVRSRPHGKMLLSAERLPSGKYGDGGQRSRLAPSLRYARETAAALTSLGFTVTEPRPHSTGAFWIEYTGGDAYLRQAFVVAGGHGYSLVLAAHTEKERAAHIRAFDATLRSLRTLSSPAQDDE
jgi:hypothetical protein